MAIGICDWGIGGAGICGMLRSESDTDIVYLSDTGYTPYGRVPEAELRARLQRVFDYFGSLGIDQVVVACNAASTVIPQRPGISGVIEHGIRLVQKVQPAEVAVVGGIRTIESGLYKNGLEAAHIRVHQRVGQPLSARIEAGDLDSDGLHADIADIFAPIKNIKHILLACTHYPLIAENIVRYTGPVQLLDPARELCDHILQNWQLSPGNRQLRWQTTGSSEQMQYSLQKAYGITNTHVEKIEV